MSVRRFPATRRSGSRRRCGPPLGDNPGLVHPNRSSRQDGFSVVEVIVSIGVFAVVMLLISTMLAAGMRGVLLGKHKEVASQEANRVSELARSIEFGELGLAPDDPTLDDDPAIETRNGVRGYVVDESTDKWEPLVYATNTTDHPFNPHQVTFHRGSIELVRYVYVTGVDEDGDGAYDFRRVLTRVAFPEEGAGGAETDVQAQTLFDADGSAPAGQVPLTADAFSGSSVASIRSDRGDLNDLIDAVLPDKPVNLNLPTTIGDGDLRAVSEVGCSSASAYLEDPDGTTYGEHTVAARADDDGSPTSDYPPEDSDSWSGTDSVSGGDATDELLEESSIGSSIDCLADALYTDSLPFGEGQGSMDTTVTATEDISGAELTSDTLYVFELDSAGADQTVDAATPSSEREVTASASGSASDTYFMRTSGALPNGLVKVHAVDYAASATASEGSPSSAPSVTSSSGLVVEIFDPDGVLGVCTSRSGDYCIVDVDPTSSTFSGFSVSESGTVSANGGATELDYTIDVSAFPPSTSPDSGTSGDTYTRWSAEYTPLSVSTYLEIHLLDDGIVLTKSSADMSYGKVSTKGCAGVGCS